jgi:DNA-binding XRE family transcriptional regulator
VKDDLQKFHEKNMSTDPQYAVARHLFDLGEAVAHLREEAKMTRGELGKRLRVKARDIAVIEDETPLAPAGLLEAALSLLMQMLSEKRAQPPAVCESIRTIKYLRPALVPA